MLINLKISNMLDSQLTNDKYPGGTFFNFDLSPSFLNLPVLLPMVGIATIPGAVSYP